jgi:hypothetical protein
MHLKDTGSENKFLWSLVLMRETDDYLKKLETSAMGNTQIKQ